MDARVAPADAPSADAFCHCDCSDRHTCVDGVVTTSGGGVIPCSEWTGACRSFVSHRCARGCRIDDSPDLWIQAPEEKCEENRPKQVGDPCTDESHCTPQIATWDAQGNVTNVYLRCDTERGECVARDPPVVEDWMAPCGLEVDDNPTSYRGGVAETDACSGGVCLYMETDTCMAQGCTIRCDTDDDCPLGGVCDQFGFGMMICLPGAPGLFSLDCPPTP